MRKTLREIAEFIGGEVVGDGDIIITGVAGIREACMGDITFVANPKYLPLINKTHASAVVISADIGDVRKPVIRTKNPSLDFAKIISLISPKKAVYPRGIHPSAVLGKNVSLGKDVAIGPYSIIEDNVSLGDKTIIYGGSFLGHHARIGSGSLIYPNVSIREHVAIGNRVIIHSGTVIGSDGFGFVTVKDEHHKVPQTGTVEIGDDVEIGANVTIDRARFDKTVIGRGTKIDNLVQIAHNVVIGKNCIIVSQVGISGSTTIGDNVILAGQAGLVGHIDIGDRSVVMAQSGVSKSVPPDTVVWGYPAKEESLAKEINASVHRLPRLHKTIIELKKRIEQLEKLVKKK